MCLCYWMCLCAQGYWILCYWIWFHWICLSYPFFCIQIIFEAARYIRFVRIVEDALLRLVAPPPHAEGLCAEVLLPDLPGCGELHHDDVGFLGRDVVLRVERARPAGLVEDAVQDSLCGRLDHIGQFTAIRKNLAEVPFFFCFFFFCSVKHAEKG